LGFYYLEEGRYNVQISFDSIVLTSFNQTIGINDQDTSFNYIGSDVKILNGSNFIDKIFNK